MVRILLLVCLFLTGCATTQPPQQFGQGASTGGFRPGTTIKDGSNVNVKLN
jgi:hypothetical protein